MITPEQWHRVTRANPCPVCKKPDWCTYNTQVACCMRVTSSKPAKNGGYIHPLDSRHTNFKMPSKTRKTAEIDAPSLVAHFASETAPERLCRLALSLGVHRDALAALGAAWAPEHAAWAFPMRDGQGSIIGIRLRDDTGRKWAVRGSRSGIFVPTVPPQDVAYVTEGPTDTAAALTLGFYALGRPSCSQGGREIRATCQRLGIYRVVVVADNDGPGYDGACKVAKEIGLKHRVWAPPAKDLREHMLAGVTRRDVENLVDQQLWM